MAPSIVRFGVSQFSHRVGTIKTFPDDSTGRTGGVERDCSVSVVRESMDGCRVDGRRCVHPASGASLAVGAIRAVTCRSTWNVSLGVDLYPQPCDQVVKLVEGSVVEDDFSVPLLARGAELDAETKLLAERLLQLHQVG